MSGNKRKRERETDEIDDALDALEQCAAHEGPETKLSALRGLLVRLDLT